MSFIIGIVTKVWSWVKVNIASVIDSLQAVVKALKVLLTAVVNLLSIFFPVVGSEKFIMALRAAFEAFDAWLEGMKTTLIPKV